MKKYATYAVLSLSALFLSSCATEDEVATQREAQTIVSIHTAPQQRDPEADNERINNWWAAFVNEAGTCQLILSSEGDLQPAVEIDERALELYPGQYTIYGFANLTPAEVQAATGISFTEGATAPAKADILAATYNLQNDLPITADIPMTGYQDITVSATTSKAQVFAVEVVRMLSKFEFAFACEDEKMPDDIALKYMELTPVHYGNVPFMPDYDIINDGTEPNILATGTTTAPYRYDFPDGATVEHGNTTFGNNVKFFLRESKTTHSTNRYILKLGIQRSNVDAPEELLYNVMGDGFTYFNRNDYIYVPITFADYVLNTEVLFYPPIGGYPAVIDEKDDTECFCTFSTLGDFSIYTDISTQGKSTHYKLTDAEHIDFDPATDIKVEYINDAGAVVASDPNTPKMFEDGKTPYFSTVDNAVLGTLSDSQGHCVVTITVRIKMESGNYRTLTKKVHIIKKK